MHQADCCGCGVPLRYLPLLLSVKSPTTVTCHQDFHAYPHLWAINRVLSDYPDYPCTSFLRCVLLHLAACNRLQQCCCAVDFSAIPLCLLAHGADDKSADLTVYGNIFVRPRPSGTNMTSGSATARRQLLQSGDNFTLLPLCSFLTFH